MMESDNISFQLNFISLKSKQFNKYHIQSDKSLLVLIIKSMHIFSYRYVLYIFCAMNNFCCLFLKGRKPENDGLPAGCAPITATFDSEIEQQYRQPRSK